MVGGQYDLFSQMTKSTDSGGASIMWADVLGPRNVTMAPDQKQTEQRKLKGMTE